LCVNFRPIVVNQFPVNRERCGRRQRPVVSGERVMSEKSSITSEMVASAVKQHLPERTVVKVEDRGVWLRHNFRIRLKGGEIVYLKVDQAFPASEKEAYICELLGAHGLPAPRVLAIDAACTVLPAPFIIQAYVGGERLGELMKRVGRPDQLSTYRAMGRFYKKLHRMHHEHSGWIQGAGEVASFPPNAYMYDQVIVKSGGEAVERGWLAPDTHRRLKRLWSENLAWLQAHVPTMVTGGALHWTVYLEQGDDWHVTKITDLSDLLYWDPAWDLASIKYPVFRESLAPELWEVFASEYGIVPSEKRLGLYRLMQHLDAAMGHYMEPATPEHARWKEKVWERFEHLLDKVEA
jgi:aminoglycoside phosphotransferase (APT) family kinase protein